MSAVFLFEQESLRALLTFLLVGAAFGCLLGFAAVRFAADDSSLIDTINTVLPQTQCGQCGYPGCRPYAEAISQGEAINKCPPGGEETIAELAQLLSTEPLPLDPDHGIETPVKVAFIREAECIGCTKCIQACPVDAILGAAKQMHTVIASECTGCDLCIEPCPVDCIDLLEISSKPTARLPLEQHKASIIMTDTRAKVAL